MIKIFIYIYICYGISTIITQSRIFKLFRDLLKDKNGFLGYLVSCMLCFSFWVGSVVSIVLYSPTSEFLSNHPLNFFFDGVFASGVVWFLYVIQLYFESFLDDGL